ncbi:MAG: Fur family transcriptional regulator [Desulfuromonas sp.]
MEKLPLAEQMAQFEQRCRALALRITPQRLEIFRLLAGEAGHPTAEQLHQRLLAQMPTLSLDTVYRTLATLVTHGLVRRVVTAESQARFEVALSEHHHLICRRCHKIVDCCWPQLDSAALPLPADWGRLDSCTLTGYGLCRACQQAETPAAEAPEALKPP